MKIDRFEDLEIWQEARELCKLIKTITNLPLFIKDFELKGQIRASSGSVMDNIAEGFERGGNKEFINFLSISKGSCGETRSQGYRAFDYGYISQDYLDEIIRRTVNLSNKIFNLMNYLKRSDLKGFKFHNNESSPNHSDEMEQPLNP